MIFSCTCKNTYQDNRYGKGRRVFNPGRTHAKCTVCGATKLMPKKVEKASKTVDDVKATNGNGTNGKTKNTNGKSKKSKKK